MSRFVPILALSVTLFAAAVAPALGQNGSRCLAMAEAAPAALPVRFIAAQAAAPEVTIRFVGHSTFLVSSPEGVTIATDFHGSAGGTIPRVVTMNRAHTTHYTDNPDPRIEHVLRGWNPEGGPAEHNLQVDDVLIRNVTTDIRNYAGRLPDANSIFIFETANLCIGHLGHLHHVLAGEDLAWIGQLDIVMVPVDGSYTMDQEAMVQTLHVLKARLILPMHYFGSATLARFLARLGEDFEVETSPTPEITLSAATLPRVPKVLVLPGY